MKAITVDQIQAVIAEKIPEGLVVAEHSERGHFYRHVPTNLLLTSVTTKSSGILDSPHLKKWAAKLAVDFALERVASDPSFLLPDRIDELKKASILVHQNLFEDAGDIGTQGHGAVERYLLDWMKMKEKPEKEITEYIEGDDSRLWAIARSADMFMRDYYAIPIASEQFVASVKYKYAGTLDGLMFVIITKVKCVTGDGRHVFMSISSKDPRKVQCYHCGLKETYQFALIDWKTSNSIDKHEYAMQVSAYWKALTEMTGLKPSTALIIRLDKTQAKYEVRRLVNCNTAFKTFLHIATVYDWLNDGEHKLEPLTKKEIISLI